MTLSYPPHDLFGQPKFTAATRTMTDPTAISSPKRIFSNDFVLVSAFREAGRAKEPLTRTMAPINREIHAAPFA